MDEHQSEQEKPVVAQPDSTTQPKPKGQFKHRWLVRGLLVLLLISLFINLGFYFWFQDYFTIGGGATEQFVTGDQFAKKKIAIISISGTIMPPFTERILRSIKKAQEDDEVKAVLLEIDSPRWFCCRQPPDLSPTGSTSRNKTDCRINETNGGFWRILCCDGRW